MTRVTSPGLFVTFEGGDGVGKTTQASMLDQWLAGWGRETVRTREPGGTEVGLLVREIVLHHRGAIAPRAEALLYAADRAHHVASLVCPALERGAVVIQDRYIDSSVAYQGAGRILDREEVRSLSAWAAEGLMPDVTVLLDLDPSVAKQRLDGLDKRFDRLEAERDDFKSRVREQFLLIAESDPQRVLVVDAALPIKEIAGAVQRRIADVLRQRG